MAEMTFGRNLLISDLHHEIGVINEGRVVRKLLIRHGLFQKCICEGKRRGGEYKEDLAQTPGLFSLPHKYLLRVYTIQLCRQSYQIYLSRGLQLVLGAVSVQKGREMGAVRGWGTNASLIRAHVFTWEQACGKNHKHRPLQKQTGAQGMVSQV